MDVISLPKSGGNGGGGGAPDGKRPPTSTNTATKQIPCKYFSSDEGCKKGAECTFKHDWSLVDKYGRCFNCGSTQHTKKDCGVKARRPSDGAKAARLNGGDKTSTVNKPPDEAKGKGKENPSPAMKKEVNI